MVTLDQWAVIYATQDPYCPPELQGIRLVGVVTGHPRKKDGTVIQSTRVVEVEGKTVLTRSGTKYHLQDPSPEYREWLREHRPNWNPEEPIKDLR